MPKKPKTPLDAPEWFANDLRKAMTAAESIAAADHPMSARAAALERLIRFWQITLDGIHGKGPIDDDPL